MKVTVNTFLNVRVGKPSVNAPCYQYLAPGSELEVENKLYKGDMYEGNNMWYRDAAKNYYWAGGVAKEEPTPEVLNFQDNYAQLLGFLPAAYRNSGGTGTTIALLDDGVWPNDQYLPTERMRLVDLTNDPANRNHGTFIAGILCGEKKIIGATQAASLFSVKFKNVVGFNNWFVSLDKALGTLIDDGTDKKTLIVNISQGVNYSDAKDIPLRASIDAKLEQLVATGTLVIAAGGDDQQLLGNREQYPAVVERVLSVGCVSKAFVQSSLTKISPSVNVVSPLVDYRSFDSDFDVYAEPGSSFATALMSGMAALVLGGGGNFLQELPNYGVPINTFGNQLQNRFQYTVINQKP